MKKLMVVCSAVACLLTAFAGDTVWTWPSDGTGDSVTNMANWMTAANWDNGVPQTKDDNAKFTNAFTGVKYVCIPAATTLGKLSGVSGSVGFGSANRQIVVCDELLTFRPSSTAGFLEYIDVYADVDIPINGAHISTVTLAGDLRAGEIRINSTLTQRLDLYAKQAGGERTDFLPYEGMGMLKQSWGDFVVYAPVGTSEAVVGQWTRTEGSKYLLRTGAKHDIPVGTTIHGEGIPEGAWVRRVFTDGAIEISVAATATVEGGDVTFDPMAVNAHTRIKKVERLGAGDNFIRLNKYRPEDVLRLEIDDWTNTGAGMPYPFRTSDGYYPGTFVFHNVPGGNRPVTFYNCHLEFAPTTNGSLPGMPDQGVKLFDKTSFARLTVTNNVSASIRAITNLVGTVVKDGAGRLQVGMSQLASLNTGKLVVEEGEFKFVCGANDCYVKTLAISNGASVSVSGGNLKVDELIVEPGAKIRGPGHILYGKATVWPAETFEAGGSVDYVGPAATVNYSNVAPTPEVVGEPALWMDVAKPGAVTYDPETLRVSKLVDVRGEEHMTATEWTGKSLPTLVTNEDGTAQHIYFACKGGVDTRHLNECLRWNRKLTGIRAIFKVLAAVDGGGNLLGSTDNNIRDFWRNEWDDYNGPLFFTGTAEITSANRPSHVTNGVFYVNGELRDWRTGFAYRGGTRATKKECRFIPQLAEYHVPAPGGRADCFSYIEGGTSRTGRERLYEIIVYTNELTQTERQKVAGYLMNKYGLGDVDCSVKEKGLVIEDLDVSNGAAVGVGGGSALRVAAASGDGELVKSGAGTLYVDEFANDAGALKVEGGTLAIRALTLAASDVDTDAYLHLDAERTDTISLLAAGTVSKWADVRGAGYPSAEKVTMSVAVISNNCLNGKTMVDLKGTEGGDPWVLAYPPCSDLRSVFMVTGTRNWGGTLIGHRISGIKAMSGGLLYGLWRTAGGRYGPGTTPDVLVTKDFYNDGWALWNQGAGATHARINGVDVDPFTTGVTHQGDLVSLVTHEPIYGDALSSGWSHTYQNADVFYSGAQQLGEYLLFRKTLSQEHARRIEAYLRQKWFGEETVGYRAPKAASVSVAAGATLELVGGAPITVGALNGAGTISGAVKLAANTVFEVEVADDGSVPLLTVSGAADLSAGGTVRLTGAVRKLAVGAFPILSATPGFDPAVLANWTLVVDGEPRRILSLGVVDGKIVLKSERFGAMLLVR